ncbi:hypothetical protein GCM10009826_36330 [Humibacillus xanthopallidus]
MFGRKEVVRTQRRTGPEHSLVRSPASITDCVLASRSQPCAVPRRGNFSILRDGASRHEICRTGSAQGAADRVIANESVNVPPSVRTNDTRRSDGVARTST